MWSQDLTNNFVPNLDLPPPLKDLVVAVSP
jgi:hypothetical protein